MQSLKESPAGFSVEINPQINMEIQETQSNQKRPWIGTKLEDPHLVGSEQESIKNYKATEIKCFYWFKDRHVNRLELKSPEINPHIYGNYFQHECQDHSKWK